MLITTAVLISCCLRIPTQKPLLEINKLPCANAHTKVTVARIIVSQLIYTQLTNKGIQIGLNFLVEIKHHSLIKERERTNACNVELRPNQKPQ